MDKFEQNAIKIVNAVSIKSIILNMVLMFLGHNFELTYIKNYLFM